MKKQISLTGLLWLLLLLWLFTSCDKTPSVYSANNFTPLLSDSAAVPGARIAVINGLEGSWRGLEHRIVITRNSIMKGNSSGELEAQPARTYTIQLEDTLPPGKLDLMDTTPGRLVLVQLPQQLWAEFSTERKETYDHEYFLSLCAFIKVQKIAADTIILAMPDAKKVMPWLSLHQFAWFTTDAFLKDADNPPIILTSPVKQLPAVLEGIGKQPALFATPDTLVRIR